MPTLAELPYHQEILECLLNELIAHQSSDVEYGRMRLEINCGGEEVGFFLEVQTKKLSGHKWHQGKI